MTTQPTTVELTPELVELQREWAALTKTKRDEAELLYAEKFAPLFAPMFGKLPLHGAPENFAKPRSLVCILGLSWQPAVLTAAWVNPERMLVIGTGDSFKSRGESVVDRIVRIAKISREAIKVFEVSGDDECEIYRAVRNFVEQEEKRQSRSVAIDVTGGKKSMGIAGGLAGFLKGCPLIYVDYTGYDNRIPLAGTEYPRLLANPLTEFGDLEKQRIFEYFNSGDYSWAAKQSGALAARLYESREVETIESLATGYGAWTAFGFGEALQSLKKAKDNLDKFADRGKWLWAPEVKSRLAFHIDFLSELSTVETSVREKKGLDPGTSEQSWGLLVINHLAAASRALESGRTSLALMLLYSAVERHVDLWLRVKFGIDDEQPDYSKISELFAKNSSRYHDLGKILVGKSYQERPLAGPIQFVSGIQLLGSLAQDLINTDNAVLNSLKGLQAKRNKCEFEHGLLPPMIKSEELRKFEESVISLVAPAYGGVEALKAKLEQWKFPRLGSTPVA